MYTSPIHLPFLLKRLLHFQGENAQTFHIIWLWLTDYHVMWLIQYMYIALKLFAHHIVCEWFDILLWFLLVLSTKGTRQIPILINVTVIKQVQLNFSIVTLAIINVSGNLFGFFLRIRGLFGTSMSFVVAHDRNTVTVDPHLLYTDCYASH